MTTREKKTEQTAAMHQAIQWTHRLETEEDIETNWSEFELWLEQSPQHREAYHRVQQGRCEAELYRDTVEAEGIDEEALVSEFKPPLPSAVVKILWASVLATLALGVAAVAARAYSRAVPWAPYHPVVGDARAVRVEDGSFVQLDIQEVRVGQVVSIGPLPTR